jgi:hypothetical protein
MGAIPWVLMQLILVAIVIFVPQTVTMFIPKAEKVDIDNVKIEVPMDDLKQNDTDPNAAAQEEQQPGANDDLKPQPDSADKAEKK